MKKRGRPIGQTLEQLPIREREFNFLLEYISNDDSILPHSKKNAIKAFYLLYFFGFRVGEICMMKVSEIKFMQKNRKISLGNNTKTKRAREAYVGLEQLGVLEEVFDEELSSIRMNHEFLFRPWGKNKEHFTENTLQITLNKILHNILGKQYGTHSFRRGYITELSESNVPLKVIQEIIGHQSFATTARYIVATEDVKRVAVDNIKTVKFAKV